ncbi:MAG: DUF1854 domain-containing protein [Planctomycetes bacterium]|nr:DUF1854 domain-containing protein [Planctomycetota bacterium]
MAERYEGIRYLGPTDIRFHVTGLGQLRATLADGTELAEVLIYRTLPISDPDRYISVRSGATATEQREIGLIRTLSSMGPDQRRLLKEALDRRYFIHLITEIKSLREEFGYLYWECETDKGLRHFPTARWDQSKCVHAGDGCHIITDVDGNRYEIRDIEKLDLDSRTRFRRYIYW